MRIFDGIYCRQPWPVHIRRIEKYKITSIFKRQRRTRYLTTYLIQYRCRAVRGSCLYSRFDDYPCRGSDRHDCTIEPSVQAFPHSPQAFKYVSSIPPCFHHSLFSLPLTPFSRLLGLEADRQSLPSSHQEDVRIIHSANNSISYSNDWDLILPVQQRNKYI